MEASVAFSVSRSADTSTVCAVVPISSTRFTVEGRFTSNCKLRCSCLRKPVISTTSVYVPGGNARKSYSPEPFVLASRWRPCWELVRDTFAPTRTAPLLSNTAPCRDVVPVCAKLSEEVTKRIKVAVRKLRVAYRNQSIDCSFSTLKGANKTDLCWGDARGVRNSERTQKQSANFSRLVLIQRHRFNTPLTKTTTRRGISL